MKIKYLILAILLALILIPIVSADCTVTFDKTSYIQGETASADMVCTGAEEKSKVYVLNWTYANGTQLEIDTGTTPATPGQHFYETYTISSTHPAGVYFNATLTGSGLEGTDSANVTAGSANSLIITGATVGGGWMGLASSFRATIKDENGKKITGGQCHVNIRDNGDTNTLLELQTRPVGGEMTQHWVLKYDQFIEARSYVVHINCYCGITGTTDECIDEDGVAVANSIGEATVPFTTNTWVTFNDDELPIIYENGTDYPNPSIFAGFDTIYWTRNITNNYGTEMKATVTRYLINNATGGSYEHTTALRTIRTGNEISTFEYLIPPNIPTGVYYMRLFYDVTFEGVDVGYYTKTTETFNITSVHDTFLKHNHEIRTFDLAVINLSSSIQSSTVTPIDGSVTYLTAGEVGEFCINATNNYDDSIYTELSGMLLHNPTTGLTWDVSTHALARAKEKPIGTSWLCYSIQIPELIQESSDWQFQYTGRIGRFDNIFNCGSECDFNGETDYFWIREEAGRFEIVSDVNYPEIRHFGGWSFFEETINNKTRDYFNTKINTTELYEKNLDPNNKIVDDDWDLYAIFSEQMPCSTDLYNYTVLDANGIAVENELEAKALQWYENGERIERCALSIENINLSDPDDDYFDIYVWFNQFDERQTKALEGIENKTGTFHLDVNCPPTGTIGSDMDCTITAYVEDSQMVQKEVDFTCYISDGTSQYSSVNFNQMITRNALSINRSFAVPPTFISGQQYVLQCHADYYNLGSRRDSFYDTFTATTTLGGGRAGITGGVVGEEEEGEGEGEGSIIDKISPFSPDRNWIFMFIELIILAGLIILIWLYIKKKRKNQHHYYHEKSNWKIMKKILLILLGLIILTGIIVGIIYGYNYIGNSILNTSENISNISDIEIQSSQSYPIIQDGLFRGIILTAFIVLMIIILFKALNLRGEIKFGHDSYTKGFHEDRKSARLQQKLNQIMLKNEIKRATTKEDIKIRKMTPAEFREFVKKKDSN